MRKICLILIFIFLLTSQVNIILAQDLSIEPSITPVPTLVDLGDIPDNLDMINKANLPLQVGSGINNTLPFEKQEITPGVTQTPEEVEKLEKHLKAAKGYIVASDREGPVDTSSNEEGFWDSLIKTIINLLGLGNKKATQFAESALPLNMPEKTHSAINQQESAGNNSQVLGLSSEEKAMEWSLSLRQCAQLPLGMCDNDNVPLWRSKSKANESLNEKTNSDTIPTQISISPTISPVSL